MKHFLNDDAQIFLSGCLTASGKKSLSEQVSKKLPGREVTGFSEIMPPVAAKMSYLGPRKFNLQSYSVNSKVHQEILARIGEYVGYHFIPALIPKIELNKYSNFMHFWPRLCLAAQYTPEFSKFIAQRIDATDVQESIARKFYRPSLKASGLKSSTLETLRPSATLLEKVRPIASLNNTCPVMK